MTVRNAAAVADRVHSLIVTHHYIPRAALRAARREYPDAVLYAGEYAVAILVPLGPRAAVAVSADGASLHRSWQSMSAEEIYTSSVAAGRWQVLKTWAVPKGGERTFYHGRKNPENP